MSTVIFEAIDAEIADAHKARDVAEASLTKATRWLEQLQAVRADVAKALETAQADGQVGGSDSSTGSEAAKSEPAKPRSRKRASNRAKRSGAQPASTSSGKPGTSLSDAELSELDDQVVDVLAGIAAWTSAGAVYKRIDRDKRTIRQSFERLVETDRVERKGVGAGTRYRAGGTGDWGEGQVKPPPSDPAPLSGAEEKIKTLVDGWDEPLPAGGIALRMKMPGDDVNRALAGLCERGLIRRVPPGNGFAAARYASV